MEFNVEIQSNRNLRIFLDGDYYDVPLFLIEDERDPIKKALELNFERDIYNGLDELQKFEYDKVNNEIKERGRNNE